MQNCAVDAADLYKFGAYTGLFGIGPFCLLIEQLIDGMVTGRQQVNRTSEGAIWMSHQFDHLLLISVSPSQL